MGCHADPNEKIGLGICCRTQIEAPHKEDVHHTVKQATHACLV